MKISINYQEYDQLCQIIPELDIKLKRLPTKRELSLISGENTIFFLSLFVWMLEKENCIPDTETGEKFRTLLNDQLDEGMDYFQQNTDIGCNEKILVDYEDYEKIYMLVNRIDFLDVTAIPPLKNIDAVFPVISKFSFGLLMILLVKNANRSQTVSYQALRSFFYRTFLVKRDVKCVEMKTSQYDSIKRIVNNLKFDRSNWWPTMEEVNHIIEPNFDICFSFIVWLLETGTPETVEQKKVKCALEALKKEHARICTDSIIEWV